MKVFHTVSGLRDDLNKDRRQGLRVGFVPTMGNLHDGHLALIKQARESNDVVVCSIFVNALQFGLNEDWDKYPRTYKGDCDKLRDAGCDYMFHPDDIEMYPNGLDTQSRVICPTMTDVLCGASRPGHFEGVTTVVSKLFNIVQPDEAIFGIKDYQQLAVIRRMAEDLCMPIRISSAPIHREADGLAMSSRNRYITAEERPLVTVLKNSLEWMAAEIKSGNLLKKVKLKDNTFIEYYDNIQIRTDALGQQLVQYIQTTTGRVIFNYTIQKTLKLVA